eukprot:c17282_g1_i1.p1 GENE.c17282_g1_i1~~c17282_g1_i1.p1  ORF type:complete len:521 (+),score=236.22 c17282_g1_i1:126-1565(+)
MSELKKRLVLQLFEVGAVKFGQFTLKSGISSPIYLDLRVIVSFPKLLEDIASAMWESVQSAKFSVMCGVPYTALPITTVMSVAHSVPMVMRRKEAKEYGTKKLIEGAGFNDGDICLVVEDLVTSGASVLETVDALGTVGLKVQDTVVLIDRKQGGRENLLQRGIQLHSVFTIFELLEILHQEKKITSEAVESVTKFINSTSTVSSNSTSVAPVVSSTATTTVTTKKLSYIERSNLAKSEIGKRLFMVMESKQSNLCVAVDTSSAEEILKIAEEVGPAICMLKTHIDIVDEFPSYFPEKIKSIAQKYNFLIFEDRKFADIGNTVKSQFTAGVFKMNQWCDVTNAHGLPGDGVIDGLKAGSKLDSHGLLLVAEMSSAGHLCSKEYSEAVIAMATRHPEYVSGFICQKALLPNSGMIHCTPGVKFATDGDGLGQQYNSPETAIANGADVIIVGRGITHAKNPVDEANKYRVSGWQAYRHSIE